MRAIRAIAISVLFALPGLAVGEWGVAPDGTKGQLHVVKRGDTLWDITDHYLGTPWIWPSVWKENALENPHLINPGDLIWITDKGMRRMTAEEAAQIALFEEEQATEAQQEVVEPIQLENADTSGDTHDPFAALDDSGPDIDRVIHFPGLHRFGFVSPQEMEGAATMLGNHDDYYWVAQERRAIVSIGEGQAHVGDRHTIFRTRRRVQHPDTGKNLGFFVQNLGTAEVTEVHPESSYVKILSSYSEIEPGDRLIPFKAEAIEFTVTPTELAYNGVIVAQQPYRQWAGEGDLVLIDRGSFDGVQVGNELELYRAGHEMPDPRTGSRVLVPDDVLGHMFVLKVGPQTSMALVRRSKMQIQVGDRFRSL